MGSYDALLKPLTIKHVTFRNRIMGSSHAPAYGKDGKPQERYQLYHEEKAKGGIGLAMFGGSSSVSIDSPAALWNQISVGDDSVIPFFKQFSARIHRHGAKLMCQLTHMGRRARWDSENWLPTISPSPLREPAHRSFPKEMEDFDIERVQEDFAAGRPALPRGRSRRLRIRLHRPYQRPVPLPRDQPADRSIRRQPREPDALSPGDAGQGAGAGGR